MRHMPHTSISAYYTRPATATRNGRRPTALILLLIYYLIYYLIYCLIYYLIYHLIYDCSTCPQSTDRVLLLRGRTASKEENLSNCAAHPWMVSMSASMCVCACVCVCVCVCVCACVADACTYSRSLRPPTLVAEGRIH
jgi:hypothetical protein